MNIYVGNLPRTTSEDEVKGLFSAYGEVNSVRLIKDFETGQLKGFGFVVMSQTDGNNAIEALNESDFNGYSIIVNEARERRTSNGGRGGYGNRSNGGGHRGNRF